MAPVRAMSACCAAVLALALVSPLVAQSDAWDVTKPRGQTREISFTTNEGTWMSVDIFTDPIQSFSLSPLGQSSDSTSPHYSDLARLLSERRLKPTLFNRDEILKGHKSVKRLEIDRAD